MLDGSSDHRSDGGFPNANPCTFSDDDLILHGLGRDNDTVEAKAAHGLSNSATIRDNMMHLLHTRKYNSCQNSK
jgi:hypothetical protein